MAWSGLLCMRGSPGRSPRIAYGRVRVTSAMGTAAGSASCGRVRRPSGLEVAGPVEKWPPGVLGGGATLFSAALALGRDRDRDGSQGRLQAFGLSPWEDGTATS